MADLTEISNFEAGIYQLETTDAVQGGLNGISNLASNQLANRTLFLKNQADAHALAADPHPQYLTPDEALLLSDSPAYRDVLVISMPTTLTPADLNRLIVFNSTVATDVNLPSIALCPIGSVFAFKNMSATSSIELVANGTDVFDGVSLANVITIQPSQTLLIAAGEIVVGGVLATWLIVEKANESPKFSGVVNISTSTTLSAQEANKLIIINDQIGLINLELPLRELLPTGARYYFKNNSPTFNAVVRCDSLGDGVDSFDNVNNSTVITLLPGETFVIAAGEAISNPAIANRKWLVTSGTANFSGGVVGAQAWQNMTATRLENVNYTNSTGRNIFLNLLANRNIIANGELIVIVDGLSIVIAWSSINSNDGPVAGSIIIPNGAVYSASSSNGAIIAWHEFR
ncbi:MAG: hypothetical protein HOP06_11745 [Methylotenera sp.]|nr:hypothetical protein [Methylotenera sp.]